MRHLPEFRDADKLSHVLAGIGSGRLARVCAIVFTAFILSACSSASFGSTFRSSGPSTHQLRVIVDRSAISEDDARALEDALSQAAARAETAGFVVRRINSPNDLGILITSETEDSSDVGAALNALINSASSTEQSGPVAPFSGEFRQDSPAVGGNEYTLDVSVDGAVLREAIQALVTQSENDGRVVISDTNLIVSYEVTMPGEVKDSTGEWVSRDTVRWAIPLDGVTRMMVVATVGKETPWLLVTLITLMIVAGVSFTAYSVYQHLSTRPLRRIQQESAPLEPPAFPVTPAPTSQAGQVKIEDVLYALRESAQRAISGASRSRERELDPIGTSKGERVDGADPQRD